MPNPGGKNWLIVGYRIRFDPNTHRGEFWLNMDNDAAPEVHKDDLTAQDIAAITAILTRGKARYFEDGSLGI